MDAKELQAIIEREKWDRFHAAQSAGMADNPAVKRLKAFKADYEAKHGPLPEGTPSESSSPATPSTPATPGPLLRQAELLSEALRRIRRGDVVEASAPSRAAHKLDRLIISG